MDEGTDTGSGAQDLSALLTANPTALNVAQGASGQSSVTLAGNGTTVFTMSAAGLPTGVTASFSPTTITGSHTSVVTFTASRSAATGSATTVTLTATSQAGATRHVTVALTVVAGGAGGGSGGGAGGGAGGGSGGSGGVGPTGGSVDLLRFGTVGDTRPPACEDSAHYPTPIINAIADAAQARKAQFMLDTGDHMYVCNNSLAEATTQMNMYTQATARFSNTWFMTMGNHECWKGPCLAGSTNANYVAFMSALAPISNLPYYSFNVQTRLGRVTFVVVADNAWDSTQSAWLERTLADADAHATSTIVARHHPEGDTSVSTNPESMAIIRAHKFALFITGHSHLYKHMTTDNGRDLVIGIGGAPLLAAGQDYNGYAMVEQQADGTLQVNVYNVVGDVLRDSWSVGPNQ